MKYAKAIKSYWALKSTMNGGACAGIQARIGTLHMYTNSFISLRVLGRLLHEHARCINE